MITIIIIVPHICHQGGSSEPGDVTEVIDWQKEGIRGGVKVKWKSTKKEGQYRVGGEGVVDVIYEEPGVSGKCFMEHLPVVGKSI